MVGQHIGKYRVTQQVGRGGMGTVYCAIDETLHRDVAIKVLNTGLDDPTVARRFRAEAITVARLNHPGIATIYELVQHDGQWLMVMEFVRGETLEQALAAQGPMPVSRAAELVMQLLAALAHAHGLGVVHRDLKPANIMLTAGGGLKIMDFGIARVAGAEQLTSAGFMMGTPAYMAPEQVLGGEIDARSDLYAVGIVLFQMVTSAMPFAGKTPVQVAQARINEQPAALASLRPDLPAWLAQVIDIALARDPDRRFQSAMLLREAVRRGLADLPIDVPDPELAAAALTAGPGVLRVVKGGIPSSPRPTAPPAAALPTMAGPLPVAVPAPPRTEPAVHAQRPARALSPVVIAGAAAVLLAIAGGAWFLPRSPSPAASAPDAAQQPASPVAVDPAAAAAPAPTALTGPVGTVSPSTAPPPPPLGSTASLSLASRGVAAGAAASATGPAPSRPTGGPANPTPPPAATPPPSALFRGVRALVVTGQRAQERPAVLAFADGAVTLFDEGGRTPLVRLPYRQVTSAAYTRDRDPRWYPTLAGPPIDVDMPGGLFRGDRHWMALQSRDAWMIVRMNDGDWRPITEAVTTFLGLKVEELRP